MNLIKPISQKSVEPKTLHLDKIVGPSIVCPKLDISPTKFGSKGSNKASEMNFHNLGARPKEKSLTKKEKERNDRCKEKSGKKKQKNTKTDNLTQLSVKDMIKKWNMTDNNPTVEEG